MPKIKLSLTQVQEAFSISGCELLSNQYNGTKSKLLYKCSCGNIAEIIFNKFKLGRRCKNCAGERYSKKRRFSYEYIKNFFKYQNCDLLEESYKNCFQLLRYICKCGNISKISFCNFKAGHRCKNCVDLTGPNSSRWNCDREAVKNNELFRKKCYSIIRHSLKSLNLKKNQKSVVLLGYTPPELQSHITNYVNWEVIKNSKWHLDHIFPIKAFADYGITDLKIINNLNNLQPVSDKFNYSKNAKYNKEEFQVWLLDNGIDYVKK